ncbi:MAG: Rieske (2Fe-2S) protein [Gemmatimonadetes bacterium]|nr:Rieske (2Fe-2S) protein [Gemmatimonadota bacterium]
MERRRFVEVAAGSLAATLVPGCAAFVATPVVPVNGEIRLAPRNFTQLERPGGHLKIRPAGTETTLYVIATGEGRFVVLSSICTHLSCTVRVEGTELRCPCHGSTFDLEGKVLLGPATRPLQRYPASLTPEGELVIRYADRGA